MNTDYTYKPGRFFVIAFSTTFVLWGLGAVMSYSEALSSYYMLLMLPGLLAPFIVSTWMILRSGNHTLKRDLRRRLFDLRLMRPSTFPFLILIMPMVVLISALISLLFGQPTSQFAPSDGFSFSTGFVPVLLLLLMAATFEELGWRGYAFDSLRSRYDLFTASLIFGVLWSLWHVPLVFVKDSYQYEIYRQNPWFALNFFVGIVPLGVIISWVCIKNRKSVAAAILFHFIINMSQEVLAINQVTKCIETGVLALVAAGLVVLDRDTFFDMNTSPFRSTESPVSVQDRARLRGLVDHS
jgi:hypothetical protein